MSIHVAELSAASVQANAPAAKNVYCIRIKSAAAGATLALDNVNKTVTAKVGMVYVSGPDPWGEIFLTGTVTIEYSTTKGAYLPPAPNVQVALDGSSNTVVVGAGTAGAPSGGVVSVQDVDVPAAGVLGANGATLQVAVAGQGSAGLAIPASTTLVGTIVPEVSFDGGTTWTASWFVYGSNPTWQNNFAAASGVANQLQIYVQGGASHARVRVSAYTSGTVNATIRATETPFALPAHLGNPGTVVGGPALMARVGGIDAGGVLREISLDTAGRLLTGTVSSPAIYDTTSAVNTLLDTGVLDVSAYTHLWIGFSMSGGVPALAGFDVDDTGANFAQCLTAAAAAFCSWGAGVIMPVGAGSTAQQVLPRRVRFTSQPIVGQTSRLRIEGRRQ